MFKRELLEYSNGLKHVHYHVPFMKSVLMDFYVGTGCTDESSPEQFGAAHFLEHMVFNGSKKYPERESTDNLVSSLGVYQNAWTWSSMTTYYMIANEENFTKAFDILFHRVFNPLLREDDTLKEIGIIQEERLMTENNPWVSLIQEVDKRLFSGTEYEHEVIGTKESIGGMNGRILGDFHKDGYDPSNVWFVTYGGMEIDEIDRIVSPYFKPMISKRKRSRDLIQFARLLGDSDIEIRKDIELGIYMVQLVLPLPETLERVAAITVLESLLGSGNGSRFTDELLLKESLVSGVDVGFSYLRDMVTLSSMMDADVENLTKVKEIVLKYLVETDLEPNADEITRAVNYTYGNLLRSLEDVHYLSSTSFQNLEMINFLSGTSYDLGSYVTAVKNIGSKEIKELMDWIGENASWVDGVALPK